jgi:hypothetical protein
MMNKVMTAQPELGLGTGVYCSPRKLRQRRMRRAQWWFQQMRAIVDRAPEPPSVTAARSEQTSFVGRLEPLAPAAPARPGPEQREFSE